MERLRRSPEQEEVYRRAYETVSEVRKGIASDEDRPHKRFENRTPDDVFYQRKPLPAAA